MSRFFLVFIALLQLTFSASAGFCAGQNNLGDVLDQQAQRYFQEARRHVSAGDLDSALGEFQKVIAIRPDFVPAYNEAGVLLTIKGQIGAAKEMYLRSIQMAPNKPESYSNLALLYEEEGDFANAALCWKTRSNLGGANDPWTQVAAKRLEEIAQEYPQVYRDVEEGKYQLAFPSPGKPTYSEEPQVREPAEQGVRFEAPERVDLFNRDQLENTQKQDSGAFALDYLGRAKDFYSRGEYVGALREATIAEYLDPANKEINAFVQEIRKAILE